VEPGLGRTGAGAWLSRSVPTGARQASSRMPPLERPQGTTTNCRSRRCDDGVNLDARRSQKPLTQYNSQLRNLTGTKAGTGPCPCSCVSPLPRLFASCDLPFRFDLERSVRDLR